MYSTVQSSLAYWEDNISLHERQSKRQKSDKLGMSRPPLKFREVHREIHNASGSF